jgi:hypothetical protein
VTLQICLFKNKQLNISVLLYFVVCKIRSIIFCKKLKKKLNLEKKTKNVYSQLFFCKTYTIIVKHYFKKCTFVLYLF